MARSRRQESSYNSDRGPGRRSGGGSGGGGGGGGRGGRGGRRDESESGIRRARRPADGSFSSAVLMLILLFLVLSSVGLWVWYHNREVSENDTTSLKAAYNDWLKQCQDGLKGKSDDIAKSLKPVYADVPASSFSTAFVAQLCQKYGPTLDGTGATYAWCKKTWDHNGTHCAANLDRNNSGKYLSIPVSCKPLGEPITLQNINGQPNQTGQLACFYDLDDNMPKAILTLYLAPEPGAPITTTTSNAPPEPATPATPATPDAATTPPPAETPTPPANTNDPNYIPPPPGLSDAGAQAAGSPPAATPAAPPHPAAEPPPTPPKTVPPTTFTLWFDMPIPSGDAKRYLDSLVHPVVN